MLMQAEPLAFCCDANIIQMIPKLFIFSPARFVKFLLGTAFVLMCVQENC